MLNKQRLRCCDLFYDYVPFTLCDKRSEFYRNMRNPLVVFLLSPEKYKQFFTSQSKTRHYLMMHTDVTECILK